MGEKVQTLLPVTEAHNIYRLTFYLKKLLSSQDYIAFVQNAYQTTRLQIYSSMSYVFQVG